MAEKAVGYLVELMTEKMAENTVVSMVAKRIPRKAEMTVGS